MQDRPLEEMSYMISFVTKKQSKKVMKLPWWGIFICWRALGFSKL